MSATPRTDAATKLVGVARKGVYGPSALESWIEPDFARKLELENNGLRLAIRRMHGNAVRFEQIAEIALNNIQP